MNCEQARTEIVAFLKNELSPESSERLEEHLARCPDCRRELDKAQKLLEWTEAASCDAIVNKVEDVISRAIDAKASDIHLEPQQDGSMLVRYRLDGVLHEVSRIPSPQRFGITARLKMMASMNVGATELPQDGRMGYNKGEASYDLRLNCTPFVFGEGIVIRLLSQDNVLLGLDKMGLYSHHIEAIDRLIRLPSGMMIVSGPTGSGKTTVAYSMLSRINNPALKMMSIEDPVEYLLSGVNQARVNVRAGFTFAAALRSFLRHDPDVIFVGEVRDQETAELLVQASLTGHFCLTTLHPDTAVGVLRRLNDMEVSLFDSVVGISAQRLVRKPCPNCRAEIKAGSADPVMEFLGITAADTVDHQLFRAVGCDQCHHTGYRGRTIIFEFLEVDWELGRMIAAKVSPDKILDAASAKGFRTIHDDARQKVLDGLTTPEEAFRMLGPMAG